MIDRPRLTVAALVLAAANAHAADMDPPVPRSDRLAVARAWIAEKKWDAAIAELRRIDDRGSADWNNLMGLGLRKAHPPDLAAAERHYDEALRIDPRHRGALEYSGELYLMQGRLARAEERLASLDRICLLPCDEFTDLKKAVARFKGNGNRHVAEE